MNKKLAHIAFFFFSLLLLGCDTTNNSGSGYGDASTSSNQISDIQVLAPYLRVPQGIPIFVHAQALMLSGDVIDITDHANLDWSVDDERVASISNENTTKGMLIGHQPGTVTITAQGEVDGSKYTGHLSVTITDETLMNVQVSPANGTMPVGFSKPYQVSLIFSKGSVLDVSGHDLVHWESSNSDIATINSDGIAVGVSAGTTEIVSYVIVDGKSYTALPQKLTVTNQKIVDFYLIPEESKVAKGLQTEFKANIVFEDGTVTDITHNDVLSWHSNNEDIAQISDFASQKGIVTGVGTGLTTIEAEAVVNEKHYIAQAELEVTDAVVVGLRLSPTDIDLPKGLDQQFHAEAKLSNGEFIDVTSHPLINWRTSSPTIASIDSLLMPGLVHANTEGQVNIEVFGTINNQTFVDTKTLTVTKAEVTSLEIRSENVELPVGLTKQYKAIATFTDGSTLDVSNHSAISWNSSDLSLATITQSGQVTALKEGETMINAIGYINGLKFSADDLLTIIPPTIVSLELSAHDVMITEYYGVQLDAYAVLSDGSRYKATNAASWKASEEINVDNGYVTAKNFIDGKIGTIDVSLGDYKSGTSVRMTAADKSIVIGRESAYKDELPVEIYKSFRFQGSAVLDGIYDVDSDLLIAGGTGGGMNETDRSNYSDVMHVDQVTFLEGIYGTQWGASKGTLLQMLFWEEEGHSTTKQLGKNTIGEQSAFNVQDSILGVIVYSSSRSLPRYVTGIQFVYK